MASQGSVVRLVPAGIAVHQGQAVIAEPVVYQGILERMEFQGSRAPVDSLELAGFLATQEQAESLDILGRLDIQVLLASVDTRVFQDSLVIAALAGRLAIPGRAVSLERAGPAVHQDIPALAEILASQDSLGYLASAVSLV